MLRLELKKLLKTNVNLLIITAAMVFSLILSYLPVTYESCTVLRNEEVVHLRGKEALKYLRTNNAPVSGEVVPNLLKEAVRAYNALLEEYHVTVPEDLPEGVYSERIGPYSHILHMIREAYADPKTGISADLRTITEEELDAFEEKRKERLQTLMEQEERPLAVRREAEAMYDQTAMPLVYRSTFSTNVLDYEMLVFFMVMVCGVLLASPVFSVDSETGADEIQRCTRNGIRRLAIAKCASILIIVTVLYGAAALIFFSVIRHFYGSEAMSSDLQTYISLFAFEPWTIGETMKMIAVSGYICTVSTVLFTLMISACVHTSARAAGLSFLALLMPILLDTFFGSKVTDWIVSILPSCGLMLSMSFYHAIHSLSFLSAGDFAIASERAMTIFEALGIPVYFLAMMRIYKAHGS